MVSKNGYRYYIIFVDDYNRFSWLYPLKQKSEALSTFIQLKNMIEKQLETSIKTVHYHSGGEYRAFARFVSENGISHIFLHVLIHQLKMEEQRENIGMLQKWD